MTTADLLTKCRALWPGLEWKEDERSAVTEFGPFRRMVVGPGWQRGFYAAFVDDAVGCRVDLFGHGDTPEAAAVDLSRVMTGLCADLMRAALPDKETK